MHVEQLEQVEEGLLQATGGVIELPSGGAIRTFPPPPPGFDPLQASDGDLQAYGFPSRPVEGQPLELWQQVLQCRRIEPVFRRLGGESSAAEMGLTLISTNVSGVTARPERSAMKSVQSVWNIPNVYPPASAVDGLWYSASVGTGFHDHRGFFKAGVQCRVITTFGTVARQVFPFWEWPLDGSFQVVSLAVMPGDVMFCVIVLGSSATSADILLANVTAGTSVSFTVSSGKAQFPTTLCSWLVEALKINSPDVLLARYGTVSFNSAFGNDTLGAPVPAGSGNTVDMYNAGKQIAVGWTLHPNLVGTTYGPRPPI
jgi:Peptidase A4 family